MLNLVLTNNINNSSLETNIQNDNQIITNKNKEKVLKEGTYRIAMATNPSIGLDINLASKDNNANVLIWEWYKGDNLQKQFELKYDDGYYIIINKNSNKVLEAQNSGIVNGTNVRQNEYKDIDAQKWIIIENSNGSYSIVSKLSGLYLDVHNGNIANGENVQLYENNGTAAQQFKFIEIIEPEKTIEEGTYRIAMFSNSNIGIDIDSALKSNGANVLIWEWAESNLQKKFNLKYDETDGYYTITNVNSGKLLDVENGGTTNGTNVWQYEENNTDAHKMADNKKR